MKFSQLTEHINRDRIDAWAVHTAASQRVAAGEDIIMLSIGQEGDEQTPEPIVNAAIESLRQGRHHYEAIEGIADLRQSIADYHQRMTGQQVAANQVVVHTGAQNALFSVALCTLDAGDEVIMSEPHYTTYPATLTATGAIPVRLPVSASNDFYLDPDLLAKAITSRTRAIVLNAPSNPLGTLYSKAQYEAIIALCNQHNLWLISDEVYTPLVEPEQRISPASLKTADHLCITICSLSKSHRMTGWRLGWSVSPAGLAEHLGRLSLNMHYGLPPFIQDAAIAALASDEIAATVRSAMRARREIVHQALKPDGGAELYDSGVGMFVVLNVEKTGMTAEQFAFGLLQDQAVSTLPCHGFGPAGKYLLRIGLCVDGERLRQACQRLNRYMGAMAQQK